MFQGLIEDDFGMFWISGKRGIHGVERREIDDFFAGRIRRVHSLTLGERDGLVNPECSSLHQPTMAKTPDGLVWVATRFGVARFDPRRVQLNTQPLESIIERLVVNRRDVPMPLEGGGSLQVRLPPGSGERLEIHFTAVSLLAADTVRFRYRLAGYDSDWSPETDLRLAFYTNLRPGQYRFQVKAANTHGVWNDRETTLSFVILPYFWQTSLFCTGLAIIAIALAISLHVRRLAAQRRNQEVRHRQTLLDEKTRIAADMHDQLGATLTQIAVLGEVAKSQQQVPAQTYSLLERISQAARDVTSEMSELVWATNPENDTLENLAAYLRELAAAQLQDTSFLARLNFPSILPAANVLAIFRRNFVLILKEALNNAIKHSHASEISVSLVCADGTLALSIRDNGKGFLEPSLGNGLKNLEKRASDLGGTLSVRSKPGDGTTIDLNVRLHPAKPFPHTSPTFM